MKKFTINDIGEMMEDILPGFESDYMISKLRCFNDYEDEDKRLHLLLRLFQSSIDVVYSHMNDPSNFSEEELKKALNNELDYRYSLRFSDDLSELNLVKIYD